MNFKTQFIILIILLLPVAVISQKYLSIPDSNAYWIIKEGDGGPGNFVHKFSISETRNDTIINNVSYIKLFFRWNAGDSSYYGAYRNETNGKSFYVPKFLEEEFILRDFTKNKGDTIKNVAYYLDFDYDFLMILDFYVDTTEQVVCGSNTYKVMYLNTVVEDTIPNYGSLVWVEKIGSIGGGIINSHMMIDMIFKNLYCMQHNDTVYNVSSYSYPPNLLTCDLGECIDPVGIGKPKHDDIEINIFPNPTSNKIYLDFGNYGDFTEIKIINSQGITMINNNLRGIRYNYSIDLKDLPVGIYTYIITTSQKKVLSGKVIVN